MYLNSYNNTVINIYIYVDTYIYIYISIYMYVNIQYKNKFILYIYIVYQTITHIVAMQRVTLSVSVCLYIIPVN